MWAVFMNLRFELDLAKKNPKAAVAAAAKCLTLMVVYLYPGHAHRTGGATV